MTVSRRTVREAVAAGVATATASLDPAPVVYDYFRTGFDGESPVVRVWSNAAQRPDSAVQRISSTFSLTVQVWVLIDENGTAAQQAESEDILDAIETAIATWVMANTQTANWNGLRYERPSMIQTLQINAFIYAVESIALQVQA